MGPVLIGCLVCVQGRDDVQMLLSDGDPRPRKPKPKPKPKAKPVRLL
jgi:hypothetical protein